MKTSNILLAAATILLLASCQKGSDDNRPPEEVNGIYNKLLVEHTAYGLGGSQSKDYYLYVVDSVERTITCVMDSMIDYYERHYYDASGRLEKIVYNNWDEDVPNSRDSVLITRPTSNTVRWEYSSGFNIPTTMPVQTATISNLGGGRKQILITNSAEDPAIYNEKIYLNSAGTLDSINLKEPTGTPGDILHYRKEISYNASGIQTGQVRTNSQEISPLSYITTYTVTKDTRDNSYLHALIDALCGTDLTWMAYHFSTAPTSFLSYGFTDKMMLLKGTVASYVADQKTYANGVFNSDIGTYVYEFPVQYDNSGRLVTWSEIIDGTKTFDLAITYFD